MGEDDWADQTRRVLTRDLLVRAAHAAPGEARSLEFRALHLNLTLVGDVADRMRLSERQRALAEHAGLDGLHEAVLSYDPYAEGDFAEYAAAYVERRMSAELPWPAASRRQAQPAGRTHATQHPVRLVVQRMALVIAGARP
jgi:DNA-directed RNA polymerase specialized sigma subunit